MIAYSIVCERHSTMRGNAVADAVLEYCHGVKHKAIVALFTLLLTGEGVFSDTWMKQTNHLGQEELVLNPLLYSASRYVSGVSFTQSSLRAKTKDSGTITTGRALVAMAKKGIANSKKALAITKAFLDQNGNSPSGTSEEDLYEYVNKEMYIALKLEPSAASVIAVDVDNDDSEDEVESYYYMVLELKPINTELGGKKRNKKTKRNKKNKRTKKRRTKSLRK